MEFPCILKEVKTKKKIFRLSWTKYLKTLLSSSIISFHIEILHNSFTMKYFTTSLHIEILHNYPSQWNTSQFPFTLKYFTITLHIEILHNFPSHWNTSQFLSTLKYFTISLHSEIKVDDYQQEVNVLRNTSVPKSIVYLIKHVNF